MSSDAAGASARDLLGKNVIVTGGSGGIGRVTVGALARRGARVWLAGRSPEAAARAMTALGAGAGSASGGATLEIEFLPLDLGDLVSVRAAAANFLARDLPLHVLVNNAGRAGPGGITRDGFELTFAVNHLAHFLLTRLLEPALRAGAPARVVNVSSESHRAVRGLDFASFRRPTSSATGLREYGASKLCNILFTRELARRLRGSAVTTNCLHPGFVATRFGDESGGLISGVIGFAKLFAISPAQGADTIVHLASAPEVAETSGEYFYRRRPATPTAAARDDRAALALWQRSAALAGIEE